MLKSEIIFNNPFKKNWVITWSFRYVFMYTFTESHEILAYFHFLKEEFKSRQMGRHWFMI